MINNLVEEGTVMVSRDKNEEWGRAAGVTYHVRPHLFQRILRTREAIGPDGPISP